MHIETEDYPFFEGQKLNKECHEILLKNNFECIMKSGFNPTSQGRQYDEVWINKTFL